jgi:ABC-type molybdenum transport system ATPase subunit/photorepair protein PhrA
MILGNHHRALAQGPKSDVDETLKVWSHFTDSHAPLNFTLEQKAAFDKMKTDMETGVLDADLLQSLTGSIKTTFGREPATYLGGEPIIEMEGVRVQYGDKAVLGNWTQEVNKKKVTGLHWRVRRGQRWAIIGANGSGKTTLVSMITSDHPQTYAQPVKLFGRSRLPEPGKPGISIFELQSRIGHSSPEIHALFPRQLTIRQAIESAFSETLLSKPKLTTEIDSDVNAVLKHFQPELDPAAGKGEIPEINTEIFPTIPKPPQYGIKKPYVPPEHHCDYADDIRFGELTTAQQRIVLFIRALVHRPDIIILDEAFSGLSSTQRDKCIDFIDCGERPRNARQTVQRNAKPTYRFNGLTQEQSLLVISHVPEEIPDSVRHFLRLPSDPGAGQSPLDFRFGMLGVNSLLRKPSVWDTVWSSGQEFKESTRRVSRRNSDDAPSNDLVEFEYYSV